MTIKITVDVDKMLKTEEGRQKLMALKLCEIAEELKAIRTSRSTECGPSLWERVFGCKGNE